MTEASLSLLVRGGERSEHFRVSLLELQKFLLEYQRVSSTQALGRDNGAGTGDISDPVLQGQPCCGAGMIWLWAALPGTALQTHPIWSRRC